MAKPTRPSPADPKAAPAMDVSGRPETSQDVQPKDGALVATSLEVEPVVEAVTEPSPGEPPAPRPVWRDVALCRRATTVYFGGALVKLHGGEWIEERERVAVVRRDPSFQVFAVESPAHLAFVRADHERELERVRRAAAELGYVLFRDGEIDPARRR